MTQLKLNLLPLLQSFEKVNKAIDSLGYPDAGYRLWLIQSDTSKNIRFMIEGSWPDQEVYNTIHKNELYTNAIKELQKSIGNPKVVSYNRFILVLRHLHLLLPENKSFVYYRLSDSTGSLS